MKKQLPLFLFIFLCFKGAVGQWNADPTANNLICSQPYEQTDIRLVSDDRGGAIVSWSDARNDSNLVLTDIYVQRIDKNGVNQWAINGIPICTEASKQSAPVITSDGNGGAIIAWNDYRNGNQDLYAQRIDSAGNIMWTSNGIGIITKNFSQQGLKMKSDGKNGAILVWEDSVNGSWDIYTQRINANGVYQWTDGGVLICNSPGSQKNPKVDVFPNSESVITWQDKRNGNDYDVYAQKVSAFGVSQWSSNGIAIATETNSQVNPKIKIDSTLATIISWQDKRSGDYDIYAQRIDSTGATTWTNNGIVICDAQNNQSAIDMTSENITDGAIISWKDGRGGNTSIYCQKINSTGTPEWTSNGVLVSVANRDQIKPNIVGDGNGGAILVWQDSLTNDWDIYTQLISSAGITQWTTGGIAIAASAKNQTKPKNISDGNGGAIYSFKDKRSGDFDVYVYKFAITGGTLGDSQTICTGANPAPFTETVPAIGSNLTYQWQSSTDGINFINDGPTTALYTDTTSITAPIFYRRVATGTSNTVSSSAYSNIIEVNITEIPESPGNQQTNFKNVCQTQTGVPYKVGEVENATSYNWTYSGENVVIVDTGQANMININFTLASTSGNVSVTATNGCGTGPPSTPYDVTVHPLPGTPGVITGSSVICQGEESVSFSVPPVAEANFYTWEYTGSGALVFGTSDSININFSATATSGILTVVGNNNCNRGPTSTDFPITINEMPQGSLTGNTICAGDIRSGQFTWIETSGAEPYTIVYNDGTADRTQTNVLSAVPFDVFSQPASTTTYTLVSVTSNNCVRTTDFTDDIITIAVTGQSPIINAEPIDTIVCSGNNGSFAISTSNEYAYQWQVSTDGGTVYNDIVTAGSNPTYSNFNTAQLNLSTTALANDGYKYKCNVIAACGTDISSLPATLTIHPSPDSAGIITGKAVTCQKEEDAVYTIPPIINATDYLWEFTGTGATLTVTSNTVTIDFSTFATSGNLTVKGISQYCEGVASENFLLTVLQSPVSAGIITGSPDVCENQKEVSFKIPILHIHSLYDDPTFTWIYTGTGATFSGNTDPVTVDFSPTATSGILTVARKQKCGHGQFSNEFDITIHPAPIAPDVITDSIVNCQYFYSIPPITNATNYIWEYSGTGEIFSDSSNSIAMYFSTDATSGYLTVKGNNEYCAGPASETKSVGFDPFCATAIDEVDALNSIKVFPNPSNGIINIEFNNVNSNIVNIDVTDMIGRQVFTLQDKPLQQHYNKQVDLSNLEKGIYVLRLTTDTSINTFKINKNQ